MTNDKMTTNREEELENALIDVVNQATRQPDGKWDSCGISAYANAILLLERRGRAVVHCECGKRVVARPTEEVNQE